MSALDAYTSALVDVAREARALLTRLEHQGLSTATTAPLTMALEHAAQSGSRWRTSDGELTREGVERARLRDMFAATAVMGLALDVNVAGTTALAKAAYEIADAMLEARETI